MNQFTRAYDSDIQQFYALSRSLQKMDRQTAAVNLAMITQQIVDMMIEEVCCLIADSDGDLEKLAVEVRNLKIKGRQFANDRTHLRRAEAILNVVCRQHDTVKERDVRGVYDAGDGVQITTRDGDLHLKIHPGKFRY